MVWPLEPEKIAVRFGEIAQADVDAAVAGERAKHTVEMEPALFERSVRLALALESVVREHGFDAFTAFDQVWLTDPRVGIIPSYGTGRLCEIGIPASPEGDVNCAVAQLIMQELAGQATTVENYVIDFDNNAVMFSHDGHGNPALGTPGDGQGQALDLLPGRARLRGRLRVRLPARADHQPGPGHDGRGRAGASSSRRASCCPSRRARSRRRRRSSGTTRCPSPSGATAGASAGAPHHMAAAQGRWTAQLLRPGADAGHRGGGRLTRARA